MNQSNNNDNNNNDNNMDHTNNNTSTTTTAKPPPTTTMYTYSSNTFNPSTRMGAALNTIHNNHHLATTTVFPGRTSPSPSSSSSSSSSTPLTTSQLLRQQLLQKQNEQLQQQQQQQQQQVADLDSMMGPRRYIFNAPDMTPFRQSEAYASLDRFICQLAHLATGVKLSDIVNKYSHQMSDALKQVMSNLDRMEELAKENPPTAETNSASRYGNLAFRQWFDQMLLESDDLQRKVLKAHLVSTTTTTTATTTLDEDVENKETTTTASTSEEACESEENAWKYKELSAYWREGFGNRTRIDYGTGHEVSFCAYMYCLAKLGIARTESDSMCLLGIIFPRYLEVMRYIQLTYKLEPAGSHGVWGLDDYSFLPFLFGSSQLIKNKEGIEPHSIHTPQTLEEYSADYMYLAAIQFIHKVKRGPFSEHSPVLNDISSVPTWTKISSGMIKMYRAEVLDKFVVMQHFLFGKLLPFTPATTPQISSSH